MASCFSLQFDDDDMLLEISEYLSSAQQDYAMLSPATSFQQNPCEDLQADADCINRNKSADQSNLIENREKESARGRSSNKVAFRTKSERDVLEDGYKWKKYGKKMVKNSPNPRNYYRCSSEGCNVKKRVERQVEDPRFVITTYEGIHNHHAPLPSAASSRRETPH
ncbi:putative WRKY transcription factor 45 [Canna indica]|uniref:WRKY transcription factor 45 n=1 Tax=Canna indica TaxID=4628 RepID=A0AAQ3PYT5_9LILI|nr:putative WRKY transcription factor 45 [Canna indica]